MKLFLEKTVYAPGETVRGHVEVHWKRTRAVRGIHVWLTGDEETSIRVSRGTGKSRTTTTYRESHRIIGQEIRLWENVGWAG